MIASMTGFGRGLFKIDDIEVNAEVRTVNNRFLDIILKIPRCLTTYEQHIRELVGQYIRRGRVNVWIGLSGERAESWKLRLNKNLVSAYLQIADTLKKEFTVPGELGLTEVMTLPDLIETEESDEADEATWQCTQEALKMALESLVAMRLREGEELKRDFEQRIENLDRLVEKIEAIAANSPAEQLEKLRSRIASLLPNEQVDESRLELELALLADRLDITEECVRFHSHNKLFLEMLDAEQSEGRKLNFLLQEMNREANTMGVKAASSEVSHLVVQIKEEVERIREQVQNVE